MSPHHLAWKPAHLPGVPALSWAGWGSLGARVVQPPDLPSQATLPEAGSCCRLGRGQVQGAKALPRHSNGQWGLARLEGHAQMRGSVVCESRGQSGASTRQQQASRQDQGLWPRRCTTPGSGLRPRKSTCSRPQPDPVLASRARQSRPPLCSPDRAGKLSPPAPRESLPGRTPIPRGGGEPDCARARRRRPRPTPPAGPDRL